MMTSPKTKTSTDMAWTDNSFCRDCIHADGCLRECKLAEIYKRGFNDAVERACRAYCKECGCKLPECDADCVDVKEFIKSLL